MDKLDSYLQDRIDKILFIELKDEAKYLIDGLEIDTEIPYPIMADSLIEGLKEDDLSENLNFNHIIDGMVYLLGLDRDFIHRKSYLNILEKTRHDLVEYIFYKALKAYEASNLEDSLIYFRVLLELDPMNLNAKFNYGLALENLANKLREENSSFSEDLLKESMLSMEEILEIDNDYYLSYYKLGYYYLYFNQYLKAKLTWEKYLTLDEDPLRLEEVRMEIHKLDDQVNLELGIGYLLREDYEKSLDYFLKVLSNNKKWWEIRYLIGLSYGGLGDYNLAIDFMEEALDLEDREEDLYNELGSLYYKLGDFKEAIRVFSLAVEKIGEDYRFYFNRGLARLEMGDLVLAYDDIKRSYDLNPEDPSVRAQKERLDQLLGG